jgi:hypothetical protein
MGQRVSVGKKNCVTDTDNPVHPLHTMPPQTPHYWCHQCQQEVQVLMAPDPVCQRCNGQFVEQVKYEYTQLLAVSVVLTHTAHYLSSMLD